MRKINNKINRIAKKELENKFYMVLRTRNNKKMLEKGMEMPKYVCFQYLFDPKLYKVIPSKYPTHRVIGIEITDRIPPKRKYNSLLKWSIKHKTPVEIWRYKLIKSIGEYTKKVINVK